MFASSLRMSNVAKWCVAVFAVAAAVVTAREAHAGIDACGNIEVRADARCTVEAQGGCLAMCEPVRVQAACSATLYTQCSGGCNVQANVDCEASCRANCNGQCSVDPGRVDCRASCEGRCDADCSGRCAAAANKAECQASCKATCSGECTGQCNATPPTATCQGKCEASCRGSCRASANMDCQIQCQSRGFAECTTRVSGGCKVQCQKPEGALFCDGNYVDTGNRLKECIDALNAYLNVKVQASGSASCSGNECTAEGSGSISCAAAPTDGPLDPRLLGAGALFLGVAVARRRLRKRAS